MSVITKSIQTLILLKTIILSYSNLKSNFTQNYLIILIRFKL